MPELKYKEITEKIIGASFEVHNFLDFVVEGKVLVELKAVKELEDVHLAQVLNYLKAYRLEVGLLINFGSKSLTLKDLCCENEIREITDLSRICLLPI